MLGGLDQTARVDGRAVDEVEDREVLELPPPRVGHRRAYLKEADARERDEREREQGEDETEGDAGVGRELCSLEHGECEEVQRRDERDHVCVHVRDDLEVIGAR